MNIVIVFSLFFSTYSDNAIQQRCLRGKKKRTFTKEWIKQSYSHTSDKNVKTDKDNDFAPKNYERYTSSPFAIAIYAYILLSFCYFFFTLHL